MRIGVSIIIMLSVAGPATAAVRDKTGSSLESLDYFQGTWECQGHFLASHKPIKSIERFTWILANHRLEMRHHDMPPHHFDALEIWGYNNSTGRYAASIFDNHGGHRRYSSSGWDGATWIWQNVTKAGHTDRFVFERMGDSGYRVTYASRDADGAWQPKDTLNCERQ